VIPVITALSRHITQTTELTLSYCTRLSLQSRLAQSTLIVHLGISNHNFHIQIIFMNNKYAASSLLL